ncbi:PepSY domain-containing protein [Paenibacillus barcinonensis]|uniref:PepSY domain-containing protein n=1 Tax=Paenibacillus barcinonensis TaxID=198119 RepID=A0A2V4VKH1_PAEBA|nr:PepSY domain-containing protein [Paenibacillus barcinonensis]PYE45410.1 putative iron-regulated membrane protein [Paenibacillus barcinonensis]QKS55227.1 PepSY domain-containing protein [Paenibacillus barcinonensis]
MRNSNTFNPFRRLHFYAAWFISPLLLTLTLSGIGFLFYPNVENSLYKEPFFGQSTVSTKQSLDEAVQQLRNQYPDYNIGKISIMSEPYNNRVTISNADGDTRYIFLDHNNQIVAEQNADNTYSNLMRNFHSSLLTGSTFVRYLVELTACWAIFLIVSGVYMTFKKRLLDARNGQRKHPFRLQRIHAILGLIIAIPLVVIVVTGIPWSVFTGSYISSYAQEHPALGRTALKYNPPQSDINEIPWATRSLDQPVSEHAAHGHHETTAAVISEHQQRLRVIIQNAQKENITRPFSIVYPSNEQGVFTVTKGSNTGVTGLDVNPYEETTAYFDQYSGKLIARINFADYGIIGKWFTWGIPLHEGHLFGTANRIMNLLVCLAFLGAIVMGFWSWMKRMKPGESNRPRRINKPWSIGAVLTLFVLGILMPLFGLSLLLILIIETIVYFATRQPEHAA